LIRIRFGDGAGVFRLNPHDPCLPFGFDSLHRQSALHSSKLTLLHGYLSLTDDDALEKFVSGIPYSDRSYGEPLGE
jgi:hypothetical protein